jgi:hypothetical protein
VTTTHDTPALDDRPGPPPSGAIPPRAARTWRVDLCVLVVSLVGALWVTARGWRDITGQFLGSRPSDHSFNEWMLSYQAHAVSHLDNPFFTTLQNAPDGVNLVANVGLQLPGIPLAPLTLLAGPQYTYIVVITLNLAATASAWYWVLSRHFLRSRGAALLGGLFCAFAPAMVSQSNGHPHITAQYLVPFIVLQVVRLTEPGHIVRRGLVLAALVAAQFYLGLEVLLLVAIGCALAAVAYAVLRPRAALRAVPSALASLGITAGTVLVLVAYPLWMLYFGPQSRTGHPGNPDAYALTLKSFVDWPTLSLAGGPGSTRDSAPNTTEETAYYGWPVLVLALAAVVRLWRRVVGVRVLALVASGSGLLALGTTWAWTRSGRTDVMAPFGLAQNIPPFDAIVVARFALITTVALGVLLAVAADRIVFTPDVVSSKPVRVVIGSVLVAALLPIVPTPLVVRPRPAVPAFVTRGDWRQVVAEGRTLVPVPVENLRSIRWGSAAGADFAVPQGYFLGPTSETDKTGRWGVEPRPTAALLTAVWNGKRPPDVTDADRAQAVADARFWRADAFVLDPLQAREPLLRAMRALYGPGRMIDGVWVWDVRSLTN